MPVNQRCGSRIDQQIQTLLNDMNFIHTVFSAARSKGDMVDRLSDGFVQLKGKADNALKKADNMRMLVNNTDKDTAIETLGDVTKELNQMTEKAQRSVEELNSNFSLVLGLVTNFVKEVGRLRSEAEQQAQNQSGEVFSIISEQLFGQAVESFKKIDNQIDTVEAIISQETEEHKLHSSYVGSSDYSKAIDINVDANLLGQLDQKELVFGRGQPPITLQDALQNGTGSGKKRSTLSSDDEPVLHSSPLAVDKMLFVYNDQQEEEGLEDSDSNLVVSTVRGRSQLNASGSKMARSKAQTPLIEGKKSEIINLDDSPESGRVNKGQSQALKSHVAWTGVNQDTHNLSAIKQQIAAKGTDLLDYDSDKTDLNDDQKHIDEYEDATQTPNRGCTDLPATGNRRRFNSMYQGSVPSSSRLVMQHSQSNFEKGLYNDDFAKGGRDLSKFDMKPEAEGEELKSLHSTGESDSSYSEGKGKVKKRKRVAKGEKETKKRKSPPSPRKKESGLIGSFISSIGSSWGFSKTPNSKTEEDDAQELARDADKVKSMHANQRRSNEQVKKAASSQGDVVDLT